MRAKGRFHTLAIAVLVCTTAVRAFADDTDTTDPAGVSRTTGAPDTASIPADVSAAEWALYATALQELLDGNTGGAIAAFNELLSRYPDTKLAPRVREYLSRYAQTLDHSGIVGFYLGTLLTASYVSGIVPTLFDQTSPFVIGGTGLAGIGAGTLASWLLTRNAAMTSAQDLWIEFAEIAAFANYELAFGIVSDAIPDPDLNYKINFGGQIGVLIASRATAYVLMGGRTPSFAQAAFVANAYGWSQFYLWLTVTGVLESENTTINNALGIIVPDLIAVGGFPLWSSLGWSASRTGIVSVSGIGGALVGGLVNVMLSGVIPDAPAQLPAAIELGATLAAQIGAVAATRSFAPDPAFEQAANRVALVPIVGPRTAGLAVDVRM